MRPRGPSGRFVLRIDPGLHAALRRAAAEQGVSLNDFCATKLAAPTGSLLAFGGAPRAVARASALLAEALLGIVVFGSWARDELADASDVDLLVVVESQCPITRSLYRRWDEQPVTWDGRPVEPHFVHLPEENRLPSGLWAEVAVDGIVLFERDLRLSRRLVAVRRTLAEGRLCRRMVHGKPYWIEVA